MRITDDTAALPSSRAFRVLPVADLAFKPPARRHRGTQAHQAHLIREMAAKLVSGEIKAPRRAAD